MKTRQRTMWIVMAVIAVVVIGIVAVFIGIAQPNRTPSLADLKESYVQSDHSFASAGFEGVANADVTSCDVAPECVEELVTTTVAFQRFDSNDAAADFATGDPSRVAVRDIVITYADSALSEQDREQVQEFTGSLWSSE